MKNSIYLVALFLLLIVPSTTFGIDYTQIDHSKPLNDLWSLEFDSEGYQDISSRECPSCQKILARGKYKGKIVGFEMRFRRSLKFQLDSATEPTGYISLLSIGAESDSLASALKVLFKLKSDNSKWKPITDYPAFTKSTLNTDFRSGKIEIYLKDILGKENILKVTVFKDKQTIWLDEVNVIYRKIVFDLVSQK